MHSRVLSLLKLGDRHPGLTGALGDSYSEAACVCLARYHAPPVSALISYHGTQHISVSGFALPSASVCNAYANELDATETGAYAMSLAAVEVVADLVAVRRAETLTGADWYLAPIGSATTDLETCVRLEVSGSGSGTAKDLQRRLDEKIAQTLRGQSNLPAIASVVGFSELRILISTLDAIS